MTPCADCATQQCLGQLCKYDPAQGKKGPDDEALTAAKLIADHERIRAAWEAVRQAPGAPTRIQSHALFILLDEVFG